MKIKLLFIAFILGLFYSLIGQAKTIDINKIFTEDVFNCNPKNKDFYFIYNQINQLKELPKLKNNSIVLEKIIINNIVNISDLSSNNKKHINFDVNLIAFNKFKINRISFISKNSGENMDIGEYGGYYYVVEKSISDLKSDFLIQKYDIDSMNFQSTPAGNTRVTCIIAG